MGRIQAKAIALAITGTLAIAPLARGIEFPDGSTFFDSAPRYLDAEATFNDTGVFGAKYYFTIDLPADAGEPIGRILINQRQGFDDIRYLLDRTTAFIGTPNEQGETLEIDEVTIDEEEKTITVDLATPVPPGNRLTVGVFPRNNPRFGGNYRFGVTVFPAGSRNRGLYIGSRAIQIIDSDSSNFD